MRRRWVVMVLAGAVVVWCAAPLAVARASTWGKAIEVPGLGSLNQGGNAQLASVSCASAGNCTAGGFYRDGSGHGQAFVVRETNGTWAKAIEVPGSGTLDAGGGAEVKSVSCATAGNCAAIGVYNDGSGKTQAFVASKANGVWGNAIEVPGLGTLNKRGDVAVVSVSCASAGNCAAGGFYTDGSGHTQAFVVSQANGTWAKAIEVPGSGTLNTAGNAATDSVSCATAGNCVAAGGYDGSGHLQAFVVRETNGSWRGAFEVPGSGTLNFGGFGPDQDCRRRRRQLGRVLRQGVRLPLRPGAAHGNGGLLRVHLRHIWSGRLFPAASHRRPGSHGPSRQVDIRAAGRGPRRLPCPRRRRWRHRGRCPA